MGTFDEWAGVVGGVLRAAGVDGFLENRERLASDLADEDDDAASFFAAWAALGLPPTTSRELADLCRIGAHLHAHLPETLLDSRTLAKDLGYWLKERKGRWIGGHRLMAEGTGTNVRRWHLAS